MKPPKLIPGQGNTLFDIKNAKKRELSLVDHFKELGARGAQLFKKKKTKRWTCRLCKNQRWVCENHPDVPWSDGDGCYCGGAGMICKCSDIGGT